MEKIRQVQNLDRLTQILHLAKKAQNIVEFESELEKSLKSIHE